MPVVVAQLPAVIRYAGTQGIARWEGYVIEDEAAFRAFVTGPVADRAGDTEVQQSFEDELQALATTGVATEFLGRFLAAVPEEKDWEIGEALAEAVLAADDNREVIWPWNENRDRRTPQASLPGADLVGFCRDASGVSLLFGEVKTSTDAGSPPQVMYGRSGMTWQLENNATDLGIQHALMRWLRVRCSDAALHAVYKEAVTRYLQSSGKDLLIVGVLLRDTPCDERDVASRARHLAGCLSGPTRVEVMAWYLPVPISQWVATLRGRP